MSAFKLTMIMKYLGGDVDGNSVNRVGGFSESVYWLSLDQGVINGFTRLMRARAALLPTFSGVIGYRVQQVDPVGSAQSVRLFIPGPTPSSWASDIPQMGVMFTCISPGVANVKRQRLAAIPDPQITRGEFVPTPAYKDAFSAYLVQLRGWLFRGADLTNTFKNIKTIDALGNVEMLDDILLLQGDTVTIRKAVDANGKFVSKNFKVQSATDSKHFLLQKWTAGVCTGGRCRKFVPIYPPINFNAPVQPQTIVRKIGRPSNPYVGRRSKRRT